MFNKMNDSPLKIPYTSRAKPQKSQQRGQKEKELSGK